MKWPLEDAARAVQFLRSKAGEWNIDKTPNRRHRRLGRRLLVALARLPRRHGQAREHRPRRPRVDPPDRRGRQRCSDLARPLAAPRVDSEHAIWRPCLRIHRRRDGRDSQFQQFYDHRAEVLDWIKEYSPYAHVGPGDPPVFLDYPAQDKAPVKGEAQTDPTHTAVLGLLLEEKLKAAGDEVHLVYPGHKDPEYAGITAFLIAKLKGPKS